MKKLCALLFLALATSACAGTFNCRWNFTDFTSSPLGVKQVKLQTIAAYGVVNSHIITGDLRVFMADTNGSLTVSNLA